MSSFTQSYIYEVLGSSRQALAQHQRRELDREQALNELELLLVGYRKDHPSLGLVKAYYLLNPSSIGRDRFVAEMTYRGYALARKKSYKRTTYSNGRGFCNLIKLLIINGLNLIWQSDTTYFRVKEHFYYLTFILDVYSRRILGYCVSDHLRAIANVKALKQAFRSRKRADLSQLIFHSDGGAQYLDQGFVELLRERGISSSMCNAATDNAYAEKLNDVIKNEYLEHYGIKDMNELKRIVKRTVNNYNEVRPHGQLPHRSNPIDFEMYLCKIAIKDRPLLRIKDGQAPRVSNYEYPDIQMHNIGLWAPKQITQIMPAHVTLQQPMSDPQLVLDLQNH